MLIDPSTKKVAQSSKKPKKTGHKVYKIHHSSQPTQTAPHLMQIQPQKTNVLVFCAETRVHSLREPHPDPTQTTQHPARDSRCG